MPPACPFASRRNNFSGDSRAFGPTIKQTIDHPFESNYKLVLSFSQLSNTLRSRHEAGSSSSLSLSSISIRSKPFFFFPARGREEEKEWTGARSEERSSLREGGNTFDHRRRFRSVVRLTFLPGESSLVRDFPEIAPPFSPRLSSRRLAGRKPSPVDATSEE